MRGAEARRIELERRQLAGDRRHRARGGAVRAARSARSPPLGIGGARCGQLRARARRSARRRPRSPPAAPRICVAQRGQRVGLDAVLAGQRRGCRTAAPRPPRAAPGRRPAPRAARAIRSSASLASISARSSAASASASNGWSAAPRSIRRAAWRSWASAPSDPPSSSSSPVSASPALTPRLHRRALLGQPGLLARLGRQRLDLGGGVGQIVAVALGVGGFGAGLRPARASIRVDFAPRPPRPRPQSSPPKASSKARWPLGLSRPRSSCWPWISTASAPMSRSSAGGHRRRRRRRRGCRRRALSVRRRSSGSPGSRSMPCSASKAADRVAGRQVDLGRDRGRVLARADQPAVGARAQRQAERVEQDRLAGAGLAGQHAKARLELELEPLDQHDVADGELPQHATPRRPGIARVRQLSAAACRWIELVAQRLGTSRCRDNWRRAPPPPCCASSGMPSAR